MNTRENIIDKGIRKILLNVLPAASAELTNVEQAILKEVLVNNKTFDEIEKSHHIPITRQRMIFVQATNRLCKTIRHINRQLSAKQEN